MIVIVSAPWCGPCRALHADIDKHPDALASYDVRFKGELEGRKLKVHVYPTIILYDADLNEVKRKEGLRTAEDIAAWASTKESE